MTSWRMAENFIGLSVLATLQDPPSAKIRGLVTNVVAGELTLSKGTIAMLLVVSRLMTIADTVIQ